MGCASSKASAPQQQQQADGSLPRVMGTEGAPADTKGAAEFRVRIGAPFPDFECETTDGKIKFHEFLGREGSPAWTILFSYSRDFSPVSATELAICSGLVGRLAKKGVKLIGLSCDPIAEHGPWAKDVVAMRHAHSGLLRYLLDEVEGALGIEQELGFPLISDEKREIATMLGMLNPSEKDAAGAALPAHTLFIIGPDKTNRATIQHPATAGRSFAEVLRLIESLLVTQDSKLYTPGNWKAKDPVLLSSSVLDEEAKEKFSGMEAKELPSGKPYLRFVDCPAEPTAAPRPACELPAASPDFQIKVGASFPDFACKTSDGDFSFHEFLGRDPSWTLLFSHPRAFSPACTSELGLLSAVAAQLGEQGVKLIGLNASSVADNQEWAKDVLAGQGDKLAFPLIADAGCEVAARLGLLDPSEPDESGKALPARALFLIAPDKTNRATILYPASTGRNFDEVLRLVASVRLAEGGQLATPGNWEQGDRVLLLPSVPEEEAKEKFANLEVKDLPSEKQYLRFVDCPGSEAPAEPAPEQADPAEVAIPSKAILTEAAAPKTSWCCY